MSSVAMPNPGVSALEQTFSSALSAPMQAVMQNASSGDLVHLSDEALQLQEANGLFGNPGTTNPLISALDPGAPSINSNNSLEAIDALLLGFTPTSSVVPYSPAVGGSASTGALFGVGTAAGLANPSINVLA